MSDPNAHPKLSARSRSKTLGAHFATLTKKFRRKSTGGEESKDLSVGVNFEEETFRPTFLFDNLFISNQNDFLQSLLEEKNESRKKILNEIFETERNYLQDLETLKNCYILRLKQKFITIISPEKFAAISSNLDQIFDFHLSIQKDIKTTSNIITEFSKHVMISQNFQNFSEFLFSI